MVHHRRSVSLALAVAALSCTAKPSPLEREDADLAAALTDTDPGRHELRWRSNKDEISSSPVSLTASDGTGLELRAMDVKVVLEDPLAFTEMTLTFHNPEDRVREGRFEIVLPPDAAISRFAMLIDDHWQEAEVVEREAARVAYEDFLHRRQDPALLEKDAGNRFRASVFPIPANTSKILKIAYSQELRSARQPYHLPLVGLPRIDEFAVDVAVVGRSELEHLTIREQQFAPRADLEVRVEREITERGLRSGSLVVGRIAPVTGFELDRVTGLTVLLDTSASRALGFEGQIERFAELLAALALDGDFPLEVLCFDQGVESVYRGRARGFGAAARQRILARQPLGASDLGAALASLAELEPQPRVLIVTDGIITAGERGHKSSLQRVRPCLRAGGRYVSTVPTRENVRDQLRSTPTHLLESTGLVSRTVLCRARGRDLAVLAAMVDAGALRTVIDSVYPLAAITDAFTRSRSQRARGKIIVTIGG